MSGPALQPGTLELIEQAHRYSSFYKGYLSNHLPMALTALDRMGATQAQIENFAARYQKQLEPLPPAESVLADEDAESFLGRQDALPLWVAYFDKTLARSGEKKTLELWTGRLMPGAASVAFHGMLRLAYAEEIGSRAEMAHALAHWAAGYQTLGSLPAFSGSGWTPSEALAALIGDTRYSRRRYLGGRIASQMERAAADEDFPRIVASAGTLDLRGLSRALIEAYAATGDFTVLHGVTACDAFAQLTPYLKDAALGLRWLWQALVCAYLSAGGPAAGRALRGDDTLSWEKIRRLACASNDEHDIKLAYACWRQAERHADDLYRRAASATLSPHK